MNTVLELVIDFSLSMGPYKDNERSCLLPDGSTRMSLAKSALINVIIPTLDYTGIIGIRTFYSREKKPIIETVYEGKFDKKIVLSKIQTLTDPTKTGGTPISAALQSSIDFLKKSTDIDKKIILVTDGEETDGGDFKVTAENGLKDHQIDYNIFIIGIGQNDVTAEKCKLLSESTKGGYVNLEAANYDKDKLANILRPLSFSTVSSSITNVQESNRKVFNAISDNTDNEHNKISNGNEYNEEIVKILIGHARSIELINKQLIHLDEASKSIDKKLSSMQGEMVLLLTTSDLQIWRKGIETNSLELLNNIYNKIDKSNDIIQDNLKVSSLESSHLFDNLSAKVNHMKNEMEDMHRVILKIDAETSSILSKQGYENKTFQTLFLVSFIVIGLLAFIIIRNLL